MLKRSAVKAIEEVRMDLNILRLHCGNRIRNAAFRKFAEIRRDGNIEMFQKEVLLRLSGGILFLKDHLPAYYEEVCGRYTEIMRSIVFSIFSEYCKAYGQRWRFMQIDVTSPRDWVCRGLDCRMRL